MQTFYFIKNYLTQLYFFVYSNNNYLSYKYIVLRTFSSGQKKLLYLVRFFFYLSRTLPTLFLLFATSINFFSSLCRGPRLLLPFRFWVLLLHHFRFLFEAILTLRLIAEWFPGINLHKGGPFEQVIFNVSEPYFQAFDEILPRGLSTIFSFYLIEHSAAIIEMFYRTLVIYGGGSQKRSWLESMDLVVLAVTGEKILSI